MGYAVMGIFQFRSRSWQEIREPSIMAIVFNGLSCLASLLTISLGESLLLPALIAVASLGVTVASIVVLRTGAGTFAATRTVSSAQH